MSSCRNEYDFSMQQSQNVLGDALDVPHEFKPAAAIPRADQIEMVMPASFRKRMRMCPTELGSMTVAN